MSTVRYRDYQGVVEFDNGKLLVRILHIDDLITTEVDRASEVQAAFDELVEDYLATCAELGKDPEKPFKGLFNVRIPSELHKQAAFAAASEDVTLNAYVMAALEDKLTPAAPIGALREITRPALVFQGFLRLSLVSCPIRLYPATEDEHAIESDGEATVEIESFAQKGEINPAYCAGSYYLVPDGAIGQDAYAIIREAMAATKMVGLAALGAHTFVLEPRGAGMVATVLRNADQVRDPGELLGAINDVKITRDMIDLAKHIVKSKAATFDPRKLKAAPKRRKKTGEEQPKLALPRGDNVIDLMEALRKSNHRQSANKRNSGAPQRKA